MKTQFKENTTFYSNTPKSLLSQQRTMSRDHSSKGFQNEITQFESVIEQQRKKYKENQFKKDLDVDKEKKQRIELQGKLLKLKEELSKKDKDRAQIQYKLSAVSNDLCDLRSENERLKRDLESAREAYSHRLTELQSQLSGDDQLHRQTLEKYHDEFQKFKKEGQLYVETINFEYDRKVRNLEEKLKSSENSRKEMSKETKRLHDMMVDQQVGYEEEIRASVNRIREEELRKYTANLRNVQQKLKASEEIRQTLSRKNHDLLRMLQEKEHQLTTTSIDKAEECSRLQQQITEYRDRLQQFKLLLDKSSSEITRKDQQLSRLTNDYNPDHTLMKQQYEAKKREVEALTQTINQLRQTMKEINSENERKRSELIERSNFFQSQYKRYKSQNATIWQNVKSKVNQTITQVSRG